MPPAWHWKTTVLPGGKIELTDPELPSGETVDVFVRRSESPANVRPSAVEVLRQAPGYRLFKTAADVDAYLRAERASWDR